MAPFNALAHAHAPAHAPAPALAVHRVTTFDVDMLLAGLMIAYLARK